LVADEYGDSDTVCIDREIEHGGLLKSVTIDGFTIDIGGTHIIYSRDRIILNELLSLLGDNVISHERRSYVLFDKVFVPYPLENGLYMLPPEERAEALINFMEAILSMGKDWKPRSIEDWIQFFGKWNAKKYLIPYNKKTWKKTPIRNRCRLGLHSWKTAYSRLENCGKSCCRDYYLWI